MYEGNFEFARQFTKLILQIFWIFNVTFLFFHLIFFFFQRALWSFDKKSASENNIVFPSFLLGLVMRD